MTYVVSSNHSKRTSVPIGKVIFFAALAIIGKYFNMDFSHFSKSRSYANSFNLLSERLNILHGNVQLAMDRLKSITDSERRVIQALFGVDYRLPYPVASDRLVCELLFELRVQSYAG